MGDPRRFQNTGGISSFTQYEPSIVRKWLQMRPLAMFVPPEIVVDGISLIKDRTLEEIIDMCQDRTASRSIDHLPPMEAYGSFGAFAEHMTSELKVATVLDQFFLWNKVERLATPGVTNVAHDCGITAGEGYWIVPSLSSVIDADTPNWNQWQQKSIENKLWAHGLSQFSLWASLAHEEVVSSESEDKIGIWTSLVYSQALGYIPWAHYGQGVWAHLSFMLPVDAASGDNPRGDKTRRLMLARAPIFALAIKFSHDLEKITGGEGFSTCYANGDVELQRFNTLRLTPALHRSPGGNAPSSSLTLSGRSARPSASWSDWLLLAPPRRLVDSARSSPGIASLATRML